MIDVNELLEKTDLVRLAERAGAHLTRSGAGWRGACPLHGGDNPSAFAIYETRGRQRWHCFTHCGDGDALDFVRRWRHISPNGSQRFIQSVRVLAEIKGVFLGLDP